MQNESIVTKIQINREEDIDLFNELSLINKRKRAYTVKKMLAEYVKLKELIQHLPRKPVADVVIPPKSRFIQTEKESGHPLKYAGKKHQSIY